MSSSQALIPKLHIEHTPLKPIISGEWNTILTKDQIPLSGLECGQIVDHCFFQDYTGTWQAWVQVRNTQMGRIFTRWEQQGVFPYEPWIFCGICWQSDHVARESIGTSLDNDVIQAPYVLKEEERYLLVYGGGPVDADDKTRQICLATSLDGISFIRQQNNKGFSRIAVGPNHAADAFLLKHKNEYYLYIGTQYLQVNDAQAAVTLRKSQDLCNWDEPKPVHAGGTCGNHTHSSQSIFVCYIEGFFYLFKMGWSGDNRTAVYRSTNPEDFGNGDEKLITVLNASACEVINCDDQWYLSSLISPGYSGVKIAPLEWVEDIEPSDISNA